MAELGMWVVSARDFCGMGIKDQKGKQWSTYVQARNIAQSKEEKKKACIRSETEKIK
jgi:hypothetical protein